MLGEISSGVTVTLSAEGVTDGPEEMRSKTMTSEVDTHAILLLCTTQAVTTCGINKQHCCLLCAFTVSTKDVVSLPRMLAAKQLYCPASASSAVQSARMDCTNVTPISVISSS